MFADALVLIAGDQGLFDTHNNIGMFGYTVTGMCRLCVHFKTELCGHTFDSRFDTGWIAIRLTFSATSFATFRILYT